MGDDIVQQILVALARIEERIKAQVEQSEHRHANLKMSIETFVPRRELESTYGERIAKLEDDKRWLQRQVWGIGLGGLLTLGSLILKKL